MKKWTQIFQCLIKTNNTDAFDFTIPQIGLVQQSQKTGLAQLHEAVLIERPLLQYRYPKPQGFHNNLHNWHPFDSFEWLHKQGFNAPLKWKRFSV